MPPKRNPLQLNKLQLKTLTLLQELAKLPDMATPNAETGEVTWREDVGPHAWSSPVIVDGVLLLATCEPPEMRAYSLDDPANPESLWTLAPAAGGCIESTPAVWNGRIYVGSRDGYFRAYGLD